MNLIFDEKKAKTLLPKILRAAIRLFVTKGIDGTTTKDIAREAGVAEGALYRHFKSKEDLAWYIFHTHLKQFTDHLSSRVFAHPKAEQRVRSFVEESFQAYEEDHDLFIYLIVREHGELQKYAQAYEHPGHLVLRIIEEGQKAGEVRAGNPYILASQFVGSVIRVCVIKMYGDLPEHLKTYVDDVSTGIWRAIGQPQA